MSGKIRTARGIALAAGEEAPEAAETVNASSPHGATHAGMSVLVRTSGGVRVTDTVSASAPLEIGRTLESRADFALFKGALDEVRVWAVIKPSAWHCVQVSIKSALPGPSGSSLSCASAA